MCYHATVKVKGNIIKDVLKAPFPDADMFEPIYHANGFAHPRLPVLSVDNGRSINLYSWGLIPHWVKDFSSANVLRKKTLNAKSEEVFSKPSFRDSIQPTKANGGRSRRCVIPVSGFFEWKHVGKDKIPYFIHPKEEPMFYLAGIYSHWTDPATRDTMPTFSILTGAANELMTDIHNSEKRMPLMLDYRNIDAWISNDLPKSGIIELMQPCDDTQMAAYTISKDIGNPKVDSNVPEITQSVNYTLF